MSIKRHSMTNAGLLSLSVLVLAHTGRIYLKQNEKQKFQVTWLHLTTFFSLLFNSKCVYTFIPGENGLFESQIETLSLDPCIKYMPLYQKNRTKIHLVFFTEFMIANESRKQAFN